MLKKKNQFKFGTLSKGRFFALLIFFLALILWYVSSIQKERVSEIKYKKFILGKTFRPFFISSNAEELKFKKVPLYIFLHGMDRAWPDKDSTKIQYNYIDSLAKKYNFIAVFPRGSQNTCDWDDNKYKDYYCWATKNDKDRNFIKSFINNIQENYGTTTNFLSGFSNGGYFVVSYFLRHDENEFSAYGVHAGGGYILPHDPILSTKIDFKVSLNVGNKDPYQLKVMRELNKSLQKIKNFSSSNLRYFEFDGEHTLNKDALKSELEFFLKTK